jgi:conserved repeat domain
MTIKSDLSKRLKRLAFDFLLAGFLFGLFMVVWLPPGGASNATGSSSSSATATNLLPFQATSVIATINGSISATDSTFTGQRHFRSGILGDTNCAPFGVNGVRFYDEFLFSNTSATTQTVSIVFTSGCEGNTYMVAYSPQFNPSNICEGYLAGAGISGNANWDFKVCGNSQFSIVVYGLEPGVTCSSYTFSVSGTSAIMFIGPLTKAPTFTPPPAPTSNEPFALTDVKVKKHKHKKKAKLASKADDDKTKKRKHKKRLKKSLLAKSPHIRAAAVLPPPGVIIPTGGTTLAATVTDSIDLTEPSYVGPVPFNGGGSCTPFPISGRHFYDEYFFANTSSTNQLVTIVFMSSCPSIIFNVYSPQFNPNDVCADSVRLTNSLNVSTFTICPNTQFSIVVFGIASRSCSGYSFDVFGTNIPPGITYLGRVADLGITKTGPPGPIAAGSNLTYLLTATNNGPNPADNVVINDTLPNGTTFVSLTLLSDLGTVLPAPVCTTPPVGSAGTVSCSLHLLPNPATNFVNFNTAVFELTLKVSQLVGGTVTNTATITHLGPDPNPANNSSTASTVVTGGFDICLQDERNGSILRIISSTGDYVFINCRKEITLTGRGTLNIQGCKVDLQDRGPDPKRPDRNVTASINTCTRQGSASVQILSQTFIIQDQDTSNNTCTCP